MKKFIISLIIQIAKFNNIKNIKFINTKHIIAKIIKNVFIVYKIIA